MNNNRFRELQLSHVKEQLRALKEQDLVIKPPYGWIRYIRDALQMSSKALAKRLAMSPSAVTEIEKAEMTESLSIKKLRKIADELNCDLVYYLLPREDIRSSIEKRAKHIALKRVMEANLHMDIEDQALREEFLKEQIEDLTHQLKYSKKLWDLDE